MAIKIENISIVWKTSVLLCSKIPFPLLEATDLISIKHSFAFFWNVINWITQYVVFDSGFFHLA